MIDAVESRRPSSAVYPPVTQRRRGRSLLSSSSSDGAGGSHAAQHAPRPFGAAAAAARKARRRRRLPQGGPRHTPLRSPLPPHPRPLPGKARCRRSRRASPSAALLLRLALRSLQARRLRLLPSSGNLPTTLSASLGPSVARREAAAAFEPIGGGTPRPLPRRASDPAAARVAHRP